MFLHISNFCPPACQSGLPEKPDLVCHLLPGCTEGEAAEADTGQEEEEGPGQGAGQGQRHGGYTGEHWLGGKRGLD